MDKYDVIKAIGQGAFGKAYLAKGKSDSKHCVIKEINFEKMPIQEKEASKKEVILLAKMKHPNIVAFFNSFQENGRLFIVMEYCDGGDLMKRINRQRGVLFSEDQIPHFFLFLCPPLAPSFHHKGRTNGSQVIRKQGYLCTIYDAVSTPGLIPWNLLELVLEHLTTCPQRSVRINPTTIKRKNAREILGYWTLKEINGRQSSVGRDSQKE
ncbi:hypothetical protein H8959_014253 [Pygathrix nigripes]